MPIKCTSNECGKEAMFNGKCWRHNNEMIKDSQSIKNAEENRQISRLSGITENNKTDNATKDLLAGLEPLFKEATETGKWFWCRYQDMWFSPRQLREEHAKGCYLWSKENWQLRDPQEQIEAAQKRANHALAQIINLNKEIYAEKNYISEEDISEEANT